MKEFKNKRVFKQRLYSKPVLFVLILLLALIVKGTWGVYQKSKQSEQKLEVSKERIESLRDRQSAIAYKIDRLKTKTGLEEEIRTKYNVAHEGEEVIIIVQEDAPIIEEEQETGFKNILNTIKSFFQD